MLPTENMTINWPDVEDVDIPDEGKDIVEQLLCHDPYSRLGASTRGGGACCYGNICSWGLI